MTKCKVCDEKQTEIDRILEAYKKDKENYDKTIEAQNKRHTKEKSGQTRFWLKMFIGGCAASFLVGALGIQVTPLIIEIIKAKMGV